MTGTGQTTRTLNTMLNARSVAVVGASDDPGKLGYATLSSIVKGGYQGDIYPVNPRAEWIQGLRAYPSLSAVPTSVDLVVIVVPAAAVPGVLREAMDKDAKGAMILSGGFREAGRPELEAEISTISRTSGLRLLGPNIQGVIYLPNKLCAIFWPVVTLPGPVAIVSQSGTVTGALCDWASDEALGISAAVNLGDQVDLSESDVIEYLGQDEQTKAIALYLEGVRDGRRFLSVVSEVARSKPIAVLKSGRTLRGQAATASHTGSLAGNDQVFAAACRQLGLVRADDVDSLYDNAKALATIKSPAGNRLVVITTSGGSGALAVDEAERCRLTIPSLPRELIDRLKTLGLPSFASFANPIDVASVAAKSFSQVASIVDEFDVADVYLLIFGDPVPGAAEAVQEIAARVRARVAVTCYGGGEIEKVERVKLHQAGIPVFPTPERAIRGIAAATWYADYRRSRDQVGSFQWQPRVSPDRREGEIEPHFVPEPEAVGVLQRYGIAYPKHGVARNADEAAEIAQEVGYPVVLKVVSPDVVHKSDAGGVMVGLKDAQAVRTACRQMIDGVPTKVAGARIQGIMVCQQVPTGVEAIVGALQDPVFGPTVMFGLGGIFAETLRDVTFRLAPLRRRDAEEMVQEIRGYSLLMGARGQKPCDVEALVDLLLGVSTMIVEQPEIVELDLNPVRLYERGLTVLDIRLKASHI